MDGDNHMYSIIEHKHRFASWAAGRAANVKGCRFTVKQGKKIIEDANLYEVATSIDNLPNQSEFDTSHRRWRSSVIDASNNLGISFTHGVAAKLINMYFKSIFVCGDQHDHPKVKAIHPPIDSVLLDALYQNTMNIENVGELKKDWKMARKAKWSKFNSDEYEQVIFAIKKVIGKDSLWKIEEHWQGFQK